MRVETRQLTADPEISKLSVSNRYAAPGSKLAVTAGIRNHGFRKTPFDLRGQSLLALNVYFQKEGEERFQVADLPVPVVAPGEEKLVAVELTLPREPVRLIVEVDGVPGEFDSADNARVAASITPESRTW